MEKRDIENVAEAINTISNTYHLSYATHACEKYNQTLYKKRKEEKNKELSDKIKEALANSSHESLSKLLKEKNEISSPERISIYIDYVANIEKGRITQHMGSKFIINMPKSLMLSVIGENGSYNVNALNQIRKMMAHELGHIALHFDKLYDTLSTNGSYDLTEEYEKEADWFAGKFLELRRNRRDKMNTDGVFGGI